MALDENFEELIKRMKAEGHLSRNSGTNSIKSVKVLMEANALSLNTRMDVLIALTETLVTDGVDWRNQQISTLHQASVDAEEARRKESRHKPKKAGGMTFIGQAATGAGIMGALAPFIALGAVAAAALGASFSVLGGGLTALSLGVRAFAGPLVLAGGAAILAFLTGLGGVTWLFGSSAAKLGKGFSEISEGLDRLDETGKRIDVDNLEKVAEGLSVFLNQVGGLKSILGSITTYFIGDLEKLGEGLDILNKVDLDKDRLAKVGTGLRDFLAALGSGSIVGNLKNIVTASLIPNLHTLAKDILELTTLSTTFDSDKFKAFTQTMLVEVDNMAKIGIALSALDKGMFEFIATGFNANFVGANAFKDLAAGITALNNAETDNIGNLPMAMTVLGDSVVPLIKSGLIANFVGKGALIDIANSASYLVNTMGSAAMVKKSELSATALGNISEALGEWTKQSTFASLAAVGRRVMNFMSGDASPITAALNVADKAEEITKGTEALRGLRAELEGFTTLNNLDASNLDEVLDDIADAVRDNIDDINDALKYFENPTVDYDKAGANIQKLVNAMAPTFQMQVTGAAVDVGSVAAAQTNAIVSAPVTTTVGDTTTTISNRTINTSPVSPRNSESTFMRIQGGKYR